MASRRRLHCLILVCGVLTLLPAALFIMSHSTRDGVLKKTNLIAYREKDLGKEGIPFGSTPIKYSRIHSNNDAGSGDRTFKETLIRNDDKADVLHVAWLGGSYKEEGKESVSRFQGEQLFSRRREPVIAIGPNCTGPQKTTHPRMRAYNLLKLKRPDYLRNYKNPCWMGRRGVEVELRLCCVPFFFIIGETFQNFARIFNNHTQDFVQQYRMKPGEDFYNPLVFGESSPSTFGDNRHWEELEGNEGCSEPRVVNPIYLYHILPQAKVILTLRDPVSRLYSSYYFFNVGQTPLDFHELAKEEVRVYEECFAQFPVRQCAYNNTLIRWSKLRTAVGFYSVYLKDWFQTFPRDQMYITILEGRSKAPERELEKLFKFLEVSELHPGHIKEIVAMPTKKIGLNRRKSPDMLQETREMLQEFYKPFNEELRNMLLESPNP